MKDLRIKDIAKLVWLKVTRNVRRFFSNLGYKISVLCVIFTMIVSLFFLIPPLFSRVPVFSYFLYKFSLPISYEFDGKIVLTDADGSIVNQSVVVSIGGSHMLVHSGDDFVLKFPSEATDCFFVVVEYFDRCSSKTEYHIEKIDTNKEIVLQEDIYIYV